MLGVFTEVETLPVTSSFEDGRPVTSRGAPLSGTVSRSLSSVRHGGVLSPSDPKVTVKENRLPYLITRSVLNNGGTHCLTRRFLLKSN